MDNIFTAIGYTIITAIVSSFYWHGGRKKGINETVAVMKQFEPEATFRLKSTLESLMNGTGTKQ